MITIRIRGKGAEEIKEILEAKDRKMAGPTAPARGLTLIGIQYENQFCEEVSEA